MIPRHKLYFPAAGSVGYIYQKYLVPVSHKHLDYLPNYAGIQGVTKTVVSVEFPKHILNYL